MSPNRRGRKKNTPAALEKERVNKRKTKTDQIQDRTASWLNAQNELQNKEEYNADFSDDSENDELDFDLFELQRPLSAVLKGYSEDDIKRSVLFECEWKKCDFEGNEEKQYQLHVYGHSLVDPESNEENFVCLWDVCKFQTSDRGEFKRHVNFHGYHTQLKTYGYSLATLITLPQCQLSPEGRNKIPDIPYPHACYWDNCEMTFDNIHDFFEHGHYHMLTNYPCKPQIPPAKAYTRIEKLTYKPIKARQVTCLWNNCQKVFKNVYRLKRHLKFHMKENFIACHTCGTMFSQDKKALVDHCLRQTESDTRQYQCATCFKNLPTLKILQMHERVHFNKYKCALCDMSCSSRSSLAQHIRHRHITERPYACDQCKYRTLKKRDLELHKNVHKDENPFKCDFFTCKFTCRTVKTLRNHSRQHDLNFNQQFYKCHVDGCDKKYNSGNVLSKHLTKKHQYKLPSGHSRFIYKMDWDGFYRLQTDRIESVEVTKQILNGNREQIVETSSSVKYIIKEISEVTGEGVSIQFKPQVEETEEEIVEIPKERVEIPKKTPINFLDNEELPIKSITDFTVMKKYIKTKPVIVEFEEKDKYGKTISKEILEVDEYQM